MNDLWNATPAPAIEQIAKIEGQSNFLSLLAGVEAGPDTTETMATLAFSRCRGAIPEVLEAHVAQSTLFKLPLMSIVFEAVKKEFSPEEKDYGWIQGAIADAFQLLRAGRCKPQKGRAKRFKVKEAAYSSMRQLAHGVLLEMLNRADRAWKKARARQTPADRHTQNVEGPRQYQMAPGCYYARPLPTDQDNETPGFDTRGIGVTDRLGWDDRNAAPGPCLSNASTASDPRDTARVMPEPAGTPSLDGALQ